MKETNFLSQRPLVCFAAVYALGILTGTYWAGFMVLLPALGLTLSLIIAIVNRRERFSRLIALCFAFLMLGTLLGGLSNHPYLPKEGSFQVHGQVAGESSLSEDGQRVKALLNGVTLTDEDGKQIQAGKVYWTYYAKEGEALPLDGQEAKLTGRVYYPQEQVNPYGFDFRDYLKQRGIYLGISGNEGLSLSPQGQSEPKSPVLRVRLALEKRLDALFLEQSGLAKALLIGVRDDLDEEVNEDFRIAGIAHVLAVSGLHVGFLVAAILAILKPLRLSPAVRLLVLGVILLMYCVLLDFTPSVVRASLLAVLLLSGKALKRRVDPLTSLAAAFLFILLLRPSDLFNLGFQLSFLAVLGIIILGDAINHALSKTAFYPKLPKPALGILKAYVITLAASLMTLVPLVNAFHRISLIGLLISPLAIALIGVLMAGFAVCLIASFALMPFALLLAWPVRWLAGIYEGMVSLFAHLPLSSLNLSYIRLPLTLAYYAVLWLLSRYAMMKGRTKWLLSGALLILALGFSGLYTENRVSYIQLSSGFADSAVVLDGKTTFVMDTGENGGDLASLLLSEGRAVNHLIITHLHRDHAGGLKDLIESGVRIDRLYLPQGAHTASDIDVEEDTLALCEQAGIPVSYLKRGDSLASERVKMTVLWPYGEAVYPNLPANDMSLTTLWNLDGTSLLNTGDLSSTYAGYALEQADILKVAHHGAGADNNRELLKMVSPQLAILTADDFRSERYKKTGESLSDLNIKTLITGQTGAVTLLMDEGKMDLVSHLD